MNKEKWLQLAKEQMENKIHELEFEIRYQRRWMLVDVNKMSTINGQNVRTVDLINALEKDVNIVKSRLSLIDDMMKEYGQETHTA